MIRRLLTIFLLCAAARASVTVRAKLTDGIGTVSRTAFLRFQLQNCGPNTPADPTLGVAAIQTQFDLRPNQPDGSILYGNLISNDDILCGGVASTYWVITPMKDQLHPLRDGLPFILHNGDTFDPSVTQPMVTFPPAPPQSPLCCGAANTPPPPTPPTTCGILPGTTNEIVKYINGPCGRLGDSSGTDDGTHPTRWPNGITVGNGGYYRELANNASPGTGLNLLVERDSNGAAQLASLSSQKVIGIAGYGAGTVGSVQVLLIGYSPLVCDGQTVLGDYFIASPTVPGECNDVGTSLIPGVLGVITSINAGADSLGRVEYFPSNGTSSGASGTVGPCNSLNIPGPIGYFTAIQKVDCDDSFTTDGAGNAALQSAAFYGLFDGFTYYTPLAGPPPFLAASSVYVVPPPAIAATYGLQLPLEGQGCLQGTDGINGNGDPSVALSFIGSPCNAFPTAGLPAPTSANVTLGPATNGNNPFWWVQNGDGSYDTWAGIDTFCDNTNGPPCRAGGANSEGTLVFYKRTAISDTKVSPVTGKNSLFAINHTAGVGTVLTNQDRALGLVTTSSDSATHYSVTGIQAEVDINGSPSFSGHPDAEIAAGSFEVGDAHTGAPAAPQLWTQAVRANVFRDAGVGIWGSCGTCWVGIRARAQNNSTVAGGSEIMSAVYAECLEASGSPSGIICAGVEIPGGGSGFNTNIGLYLSGSGPSNSPKAIRSDWTAPSSLNGPLDFASGVTTYELSGPELTTPANPAAGFAKGYFKAAGKFCAVNSAGTETCTGGTVTSIAQTSPSGVLSQSGGPITGSGTFTWAWAGTSGGLLCFTGASTAASSGLLAANAPLIGGGAGVCPTTGTRSGNTTVFATTSGSLPSGNAAAFDGSGNVVDSGVVAATLSGAFKCVNVTPVTVNTSTTNDQNLMACTIPAGTLNSVGKTLRVYAAGIYSTPAASTSQMTLKVKLCTVSGCASGTVITPINIQSTALGTIQVTNDNFSLHSDITTQTAGASSAYEAHGDLLIDLSTLTTAADSAFGDTNTATVGTIDSTAQLFFQVTGAFSAASGSNSFTERQLVIDSVN